MRSVYGCAVHVWDRRVSRLTTALDSYGRGTLVSSKQIASPESSRAPVARKRGHERGCRARAAPSETPSDRRTTPAVAAVRHGSAYAATSQCGSEAYSLSTPRAAQATAPCVSATA
jgi:hypothetical protein